MTPKIKLNVKNFILNCEANILGAKAKNYYTRLGFISILVIDLNYQFTKSS